MQNTITTILTGTLGVAGVEVAEQVATTVPGPEEVQSIGQLIIQVVIGIITIWKLLKKPKSNEPKN
jgi:hypothetical protein